MSYVDLNEISPRERSNETEYRRRYYTKTPLHVNVRLRILDDKPFMAEKHWVPSARTYVNCLGDDECPVCERNRRLVKENPDIRRWSNIPGYIGKSSRYSVNVLNRTQVKVAPQGNIVFAVNGSFPPTDPETGDVIEGIEAKPLNRVEILEKGVTFFSQLGAFNTQLTDEAGNPLGITSYDIVVSKNAQMSAPTVTPNPMLKDDVSELVEEQGLYDLEDIQTILTPTEIKKVLNGVSIRDIYASRSTSFDKDDFVDDTEVDDGSLNDSIDKLLG